MKQEKLKSKLLGKSIRACDVNNGKTENAVVYRINHIDVNDSAIGMLVFISSGDGSPYHNTCLKMSEALQLLRRKPVMVLDYRKTPYEYYEIL